MKTWQDDPEIVEQLIDGSTGKLWKNRLEQAGHYPLLKYCLDEVGHTGLLIDVGCGAGDVSRVWKSQYLGLDLDWVIEKVSKVCNPSNYLSADLTASIPKLPSAKCVLMNAFLDVQEKPDEILERAMNEINTEWFIIHRQKIGKSDGFVTGIGYGNSSIPVSVMSTDTVNKFLKRSKESKVFHWDGEYYTFTMRMK